MYRFDLSDFDEMVIDLTHQLTGLPIAEIRARRLVTNEQHKAIRANLAAGPKWKVQVHGAAGEQAFEISVINSHAIDDAQMHYGWFNENKLLISHNGGPCHWPVTPLVWSKLIRIAQEVADELNESLPPQA